MEAEIASLRAAFTQEVSVWYKLYHPDVRVINGVLPTGDYLFSKYNKLVDILEYTDEEYEKYLSNPRFDLHFIIIANRFPSNYTIEELKDRNYSVSHAITISRAPSPADVIGHPLVKVIAFSKAAKEAELPDVSDAAPEGTEKVAGIDALSTSLNAQFPSRIVVPPVSETASTLDFLCMIVHRDVKTKNMLLDKSRTINIADFRVAQVEASNPNDMTGGIRTLGYMAPENLRPEIPRYCPSSLANVMKRCWDANPDKRPKMHELVSICNALNLVPEMLRGAHDREGS
ncbi:putative nifU-like protein 1, chloroplastic-like [Capsicum annuum]|nr:putative nifU-like protein 1, chloroplastic-like [Capsicum annuum]